MKRWLKGFFIGISIAILIIILAIVYFNFIDLRFAEGMCKDNPLGNNRLESCTLAQTKSTAIFMTSFILSYFGLHLFIAIVLFGLIFASIVFIKDKIKSKTNKVGKKK